MKFNPDRFDSAFLGYCAGVLLFCDEPFLNWIVSTITIVFILLCLEKDDDNE